MIIASWNVRGLNDPNKVADLKKFFSLHQVTVVGLMETRVRKQNEQKIQKRLGSHWKWLTNIHFSPKGRIWVGWNPSLISLEVLEIHEQFIHCLVKSLDWTVQIYVTFVYGLNALEGRHALWKDTQKLSVGNTPWICLGDFNAILSTEDRVNGRPVSDAETRDLNQWLLDLNLTVLRTRGNYFTRDNKSQDSGRIATRIDWAVCLTGWINILMW